MGTRAQADADASVALGYFTLAKTLRGSAFGHYNVGLTGAVVEIGYGTGTSNRVNAMTILKSNGYVGIGEDAPTQRMSVAGNVKTYGTLYKS